MSVEVVERIGLVGSSHLCEQQIGSYVGVSRVGDVLKREVGDDGARDIRCEVLNVVIREEVEELVPCPVGIVVEEVLEHILRPSHTLGVMTEVGVSGDARSDCLYTTATKEGCGIAE